MSESELLQLTFDDAESNPHAIYRAGEAVKFKVKISCQEPVECKNVTIKVKGAAEVYWSAGKNSSYSSTETMMELKLPVFTPPEGSQGFHPPGESFYPFSIQLPDTIAASFALDSRNRVSYTIKAKMHRASHSNEAVVKKIIVVRDLDLNMVLPSLVGPYESEGQDLTHVSCSAFLNRGLGKIDAQVRLNKRGFAIGEQIQVTGELRNAGSLDFNLVTMEIAEFCEFLARGKKNKHWRSGSIVRLPPLAAGRTIQLSHLLPVKATNCSFMQGCTNINLNYFFRIRAAGTLTIVKKDLCELIIGSIPLGGREPVDIHAWIPLAEAIHQA